MKQFLIIFLAIAMCLSVSACSSDKGKDVENNSQAISAPPIAEENNDKKLLIPVGIKTDGVLKYGFIDKNGNQVIECIYEDFNDSVLTDGFDLDTTEFAAAKKDGKWGFIDKTGILVIAAEYEEVRGFGKHKLAPVKKDGKWGFVDKTGTMVVSPEYDSTYSFNENGVALVKKGGKCGFIDETGKMVIPLEYEDVYSFGENSVAIVKKDGKWGLINKAGKAVVPFTYDYISVSYFNNNVAIFKQGGLYGVMDITGEIIVTPIYSKIGIISENGLVPVQIDSKWGYINLKGDTVIQPIYDDAEGFASESVAAVKMGEKWGVIDATGNVIVDFKLEDAPDFDDGFSIIYTENSAYVINDKGETVFDAGEHSSIYRLKDNRWLKTLPNGDTCTLQFVDDSNKLIAEFECSDFIPGSDGVYFSNSDAKCGLVDSEGKVVIEPIYDFISGWYDGLG